MAALKHSVAALWATIGLTLACAHGRARPTATSGGRPLVTREPTDTADVVLNPPTGDAVVTIQVGQTVGVKSPGDALRWQVAYDTDALTLLTPADRVEQPGPGGWVWRAVVSREVDLVLTSRSPPCGSPPCPPNVVRFTIRLNIVPR